MGAEGKGLLAPMTGINDRHSMLSDQEDNLIDFLEDKFGCHTVILYGSRAIGTERPDSDWDVIGITSMGSRNFYHGNVDGVGDISAYIYNVEDVAYNAKTPSALYTPPVIFVRLRQGKVLAQEDGIGDKIVSLARKMYAEGPPRFSKAWIAHFHYFLLEYGVGGLRSEIYDAMHKQFIRNEIMLPSIHLYFELRHMWRPYPRDILPYLKKTDSKAADLFEAAFAQDASIDALERWFKHVLATEQP